MEKRWTKLFVVLCGDMRLIFGPSKIRAKLCGIVVVIRISQETSKQAMMPWHGKMCRRWNCCYVQCPRVFVFWVDPHQPVRAGNLCTQQLQVAFRLFRQGSLWKLGDHRDHLTFGTLPTIPTSTSTISPATWSFGWVDGRSGRELCWIHLKLSGVQPLKSILNGAELKDQGHPK